MVMDHFFQIRTVGPPEHEMLEAYTALGFLAAHTSRARIGTLVTGAIYRYAGILAKTVTTLDVLSGGRAWLGIGPAGTSRSPAASASGSRRDGRAVGAAQGDHPDLPADVGRGTKPRTTASSTTSSARSIHRRR